MRCGDGEAVACNACHVQRGKSGAKRGLPESPAKPESNARHRLPRKVSKPAAMPAEAVSRHMPGLPSLPGGLPEEVWEKELKSFAPAWFFFYGV